MTWATLKTSPTRLFRRQPELRVNRSTTLRRTPWSSFKRPLTRRSNDLPVRERPVAPIFHLLRRMRAPGLPYRPSTIAPRDSYRRDRRTPPETLDGRPRSALEPANTCRSPDFQEVSHWTHFLFVSRP